MYNRACKIIALQPGNEEELSRANVQLGKGQLKNWCVNLVVVHDRGNLQRSFENERWTQAGPRSDSNNKQS